MDAIDRLKKSDYNPVEHYRKKIPGKMSASSRAREKEKEVSQSKNRDLASSK